MKYDPILPRARIGFIIPSSNRMVEPQMARFMPAGVVPHFHRVRMTNHHLSNLDDLTPRIVDAAAILAESKCDVTVLQCTGTSMSGGVDKEKEVAAAMKKATGGRPVVSAASSITAALRALRIKRMVFISESEQAGHDSKKRYLQEDGYDIPADKAVALAGTDVYCVMPPKLWYDTAMAYKRDDVDGYFISCANISAIEVIEDLEKELKKPVITSNQAALWHSLRTAGIRDAVPGLGRLLRHDADQKAVAAQ
jgi:maleate isomerase